MTNQSFKSQDGTNDDVAVLATAAANALFGLVARAWAEEGAQSAEASLKALADGRVHLECKAVFSRQGFSLEVEHCSHGNRQHLVSLTLKNPSTPGPDSAGVH